MLGDALALISALFGAIWVILMKVRIKDESRVDMQLLFGLIGLWNILLLWPIGLMLHLTGVEHFELPRSKQDLFAIMINVRHHILLVEKALIDVIRWRLLFQLIISAHSRCLKLLHWFLQLALA
jgi:hypothetical protein